MVAIPLTRNHQRQNRPFNHIGVSVANIEETLDWYKKVVGFQLIGKIQHIKRSEKPNDAIFQIFPENLQEVKLARMATGNGVGFELFQFIDPGFQAAGTFERQYQTGGFFHICVTDSDPEALAKRFKENGGRQVGKTVDPSGKGEIVCMYLADPWGNITEVVDVGFEVMACKSSL